MSLHTIVAILSDLELPGFICLAFAPASASTRLSLGIALKGDDGKSDIERGRAPASEVGSDKQECVRSLEINGNGKMQKAHGG